MPLMIANKRMSYRTRMLKAGDQFEATPGIARIFAKAGRARVTAAEQVEKSVARKVPPHDEITLARAEYERVFGKRPFMGWDEGELRQRIAAAPPPPRKQEKK